MAAQHQVVIRNDDPQIFTHQGRTVRTPQIEFTDLGSTDHNILRRSSIKITPGTELRPPAPSTSRTSTSSAATRSTRTRCRRRSLRTRGLMIDVDMERERRVDRGQGVPAGHRGRLHRRFRSRPQRDLGFDPILDTPDFILQVEGSGGVSQRGAGVHRRQHCRSTPWAGRLS